MSPSFSLLDVTDASFSTGGEDGHLIISLDNLNNITLSGDYVTVGTGSKLGPLYWYLWENGGPIPRWLCEDACSFSCFQVNVRQRSELVLKLVSQVIFMVSSGSALSDGACVWTRLSRCRL